MESDKTKILAAFYPLPMLFLQNKLRKLKSKVCSLRYSDSYIIHIWSLFLIQSELIYVKKCVFNVWLWCKFNCLMLTYAFPLQNIFFCILMLAPFRQKKAPNLFGIYLFIVYNCRYGTKFALFLIQTYRQI